MAGGWFPRRGRRNAYKNSNKSFNVRFFSYEALRIATNNFSTLLGIGGFGSVYKGVLPDDDRRPVAIKKFARQHDGFLEMVELMSNFRHKNLIQIIGCCIDNGKQLLVSELADNGSVWEHLYSDKVPALGWETRAAICLGTARGLSYLHHEISPQIIHRDITPSNILLDANFVPKIVDFDLIHFVGECVDADGEERPEFTHLGVEYSSTYTTTTTTTIVTGTLAYMDPCYMLNGKLSQKADVYSFGIVMLEIITGRRPFDVDQQEIDDQMIVGWVTGLMKDGMVLKIVDPKLTDFPKEDVERFINVALLCTHETQEQRPIMFDVVQMLYRRHKSDQEISEMATRVVADRLARQNSTLGAHTCGLTYSLSLTTSIEARDGATSIGVHYAAEMESREEPVDETSSGECSSSAAALTPLETSLASSSKEDQSCPDDLVRAYFERSMEKIMRYHIEARRHKNDITTIMTQTMVIKKPSANMFKEAVYPPFLSGEFHRRPSQF